MKIAVIHARGGSKRIPKKNIKGFCGKPIIAYPIEVALKSNLFDKVIVSTDCPKIAAVAKEYGAEVPYMRPEEFAGDLTTTAETLAYDIEALDNPQYVCCIYATSPFITVEALQGGLKLLEEDPQTATAFSVTTFPFPILRALKIDDNKNLAMVWPEHLTTRSQDLPEAYHDAGQFYWINAQHFMQNKTLYAPTSKPVILPRYLVQDIDTLEDWERAEYMYKAMILNNAHNKKV